MPVDGWNGWETNYSVAESIENFQQNVAKYTAVAVTVGTVQVRLGVPIPPQEVLLGGVTILATSAFEEAFRVIEGFQDGDYYVIRSDRNMSTSITYSWSDNSNNGDPTVNVGGVRITYDYEAANAGNCKTTWSGRDVSDRLEGCYNARDTIDGRGGNDTIFGRDGNDYLKGGDGEDILYDGEGTDAMRGENGADTFRFMEDAGKDIASDVNLNEGDRLINFGESIVGFTVDRSGTALVPGSWVFKMISNDGNTVIIESANGKIFNHDQYHDWTQPEVNRIADDLGWLA